jgi:NADH-quinone oxidoreductase subunit J
LIRAPGRREAPVRKLGGAIVLASGLILVGVLVRTAAESPGGGLGVYFWAFTAIALIAAVRVVTHPRPVYSALYFVLTVFATAGLFILLWAEFMAAALVLIYAGAILVTYVFVIMLATSPTPAASETGAARGGAGDADDGNGSGGIVAAGYAATRAAGNGVTSDMAEHDTISREPLVASAVGFTLMGILLFVIFDRAPASPVVPANRAGVAGAVREEPLLARTPGSTQKLGMYLFQKHLVNLELAGLLLTISMIGAILIARRRVVEPEPQGAAAPAAARAGPAREVFNAPMTPVDDNPHSIPVYGTDNPRQKAYPEA